MSDKYTLPNGDAQVGPGCRASACSVVRDLGLDKYIAKEGQPTAEEIEKGKTWQIMQIDSVEVNLNHHDGY